MPDLDPISQALDLVEENLRSSVTVASMARAAGYSLYHFCRVFNLITQHTPYDYLMRRRLSEAARALLETDEKIIDIALDFQFNGPETFSRAFRRMFGTLPSQARKAGNVDSRRLLPRLSPAYLEHLSSGLRLRPELVDLEPVQLAGLMALVENEPEDRLRVWQLLSGELDTLGARPEAFYGLASYPGNWTSKRYPYLAAAAGKDLGLEASALVLKPLPRQTCARFLHRGPLDTLALTLAYIHHTWLPKARATPAQPWILEGYGRAVPMQAEALGEIEIYLPVSA